MPMSNAMRSYGNGRRVTVAEAEDVRRMLIHAARRSITVEEAELVRIELQREACRGAT
jgi:hypothetical protein